MTRILVVDDEPIIRQGLIKLLRQYDSGVEVMSAADGSEAVERMRQMPPRLVITDIRMPRMDGIELCKTINEMEAFTEVDVIVISGHDEFRYAQQCISYGVREYILKPATEVDLFPVLDKLLAAGKRSAPALSLSLYEAWIDQAEETIWSLDYQRLTGLLNRWRQDFSDEAIRPDQLLLLAHDSLGLLHKRLHARETAIAAEPPDIPSVLPQPEPGLLLEDGVYGLAKRLTAIRGGNQKSLFEEAARYIDAHLADELSLEFMAERVGLTPSYFSHYFKKMAKESFVRYRLRKRIEAAQRLLAMPQHKIVDIGCETGFPNYTYFHRVFKKLVGCSPSEYRARLGVK